MKIPKLGPGILVTAAFIGPGTVITASLAGANFGFALVWALIFSILATIILQEMAVRLGLVTSQGLGANIREELTHPVLRILGIALVVSAIVIGNAAYQGGNISGASLGLSHLFGDQVTSKLWPLVIGILSFLLLWSGKYKLIEKSLIGLVGLMSVAFISTFIITKPSLIEIFGDFTIFSLPKGATLTAVALIGTTIVPYNLFLHSSTVSQKWQNPNQLPEARNDLYLSISLGGLITLAILSTAATAFFGKHLSLNSAADLAPSLQPLFGEYAELLMATGLFSAGISSAITAPLAAAFALSGILNLDQKLSSLSFRMIWISVLLIGMLTALSGYKPIHIIWFAQVANGLLLPIITVFLIAIMNSKKLGKYKNNVWQNMLGVSILIVVLLLSSRSLMSAFGLL